MVPEVLLKRNHGAFAIGSVPGGCAGAKVFTRRGETVSHPVGGESDHPQAGAGTRGTAVRPLVARRRAHRRGSGAAGLCGTTAELARRRPRTRERAGGTEPGKGGDRAKRFYRAFPSPRAGGF